MSQVQHAGPASDDGALTGLSTQHAMPAVWEIGVQDIRTVFETSCNEWIDGEKTDWLTFAQPYPNIKETLQYCEVGHSSSPIAPARPSPAEPCSAVPHNISPAQQRITKPTNAPKLHANNAPAFEPVCALTSYAPRGSAPSVQRRPMSAP